MKMILRLRIKVMAMKKKKYSLTEEGLLIHKHYKKNRLIVFIVLCCLLLSMTVGYSANLSSVLNFLGYVELDVEEGKLEIISITNTALTNATDNGTSMSLTEDSATGTNILTANFNIDYYRTQGSSTMSATYEVVIKNSSFQNQTLSTVTSTPTFTSGSSTLNYSISGANTGTTVLGVGESVTVTITFSLGSSTRNTHYIVNEVFEFEFATNVTSNIKLTPVLNTSSVTFNSNDELQKVSIYVTNNSASDITYNFSTNNTNFLFTDSSGNELSDFTIESGVGETVEIYLKISADHIFTGDSDTIDIHLNTTSPSILTYSFGKINATVPVSGIQRIIGDETINDDTSIDFTTTVTTSGLFKNTTNGEITYFYRGNVTDNYVSFAGFTWRIIRIDKYGTRIILDSVISNTTAWASSNATTNNSLDEAIEVLKYSNSPVKTTVDSWYNTNLSSYSDLIKTSLFCEDMSNQSLTSSGSGYTTYYFGSYIRNGPDSSGYTPEFVCDSQYITSYNIGLISGDEVAFAGGLFNTDSTNYYLYNSSITSIWWTLSPSYYDTTLKTMGILVVNGSNGRFYDWQDGNTIANSNAIRPVITLDTDRLSGGDGTSSNPYTFT